MQFSRRHMMGSMLAGALLPYDKLLAATPGKHIAASISLDEGRIWVAVSLEKKKPELFILDSGMMGNIISRKWAQEQQFEIGQRSANRGLGGVEESEVVNVDDLLIGGAFRQKYAEFRTSKSIENESFKGLLGCKFLTKFDCDLDFAQGQWRIYPEGRGDRTGLYQIPDSYRARGTSYGLEISGQVGAASGRFMIDTGASGSMLLDGQMAEKSGLWNSGAPYAPVQTRGFGPGRVPTRLYRADRIKIHQFVFEKTLVNVMKPGGSMGQIRDYEGLVGLKAIRHFLISTDRKTKSLWVAPNGMKFPDEDRHPMSGLWFDRDKDRITISDVGIGSPAAAAGLQAGDVVVGKEWGALVAEVNGVAGRQIALDYERDGRRSRAEFTLKPFL